MTIEEFEQLLPNGFHESTIIRVRLNYAQRKAEIDLDIWVSRPDDADTEKYRPATLSISELLYFVIQPPDSTYASHAEPSLADGGSPKWSSQYLDCPDLYPPVRSLTDSSLTIGILSSM